MSEPRIFVAIASYRDPECQHTVRDLFARAAHPERITVGICWQFDPVEDADCFVVPYPFPAQVRENKMHYRESKGGCWARANALSLMEDEDYVLQIDAHMRFEPRWDELMLDSLSRCPTSRSLLSSYVYNYTPPDVLQDHADGVSFTHVDGINTQYGLQPISLVGMIWKRKGAHPPLLGAFFVGNFMFAPREVLEEVPFDPHIFFRGQEAVYSARLWTHGWDIYQPDQVCIYHYWASPSRVSPENDYKRATAAAQMGKQRVWHLLGLEEAKDKAALVDIGMYGMGSMRPLDHFWDFCGVDLRAGTIAKKAKEGRWVPYEPKAKAG